ncbi:UBC core domain-containing protein [Balamuthia mandrillaris]
MAGASAKRLAKELKEMEKNPLPWAKAEPTGDSLYKWKAIITGPENTPYDKGSFQLELEMPPEYPFKAPKVKFLTKIYHPNVKSDGQLCSEVLNQGWSPQLKIPEVLLTIRQVLVEPNPDNPLEPEIANQYKENRTQFNKTAKEWTKKYAK